MVERLAALREPSMAERFSVKIDQSYCVHDEELLPHAGYAWHILELGKVGCSQTFASHQPRGHQGGEVESNHQAR